MSEDGVKIDPTDPPISLDPPFAGWESSPGCEHGGLLLL